MKMSLLDMNEAKDNNQKVSRSVSKNIANDSIDIMDVICQVWHGKKIIALCVGLMLVVSIVFLKFSKEKWTSHSILTLPSVGQVANYNAALAILYADTPQDKPSINNIQTQLFSRFSASISALSLALNNLEEPQKLIVNLSGTNNDTLNVAFNSSSPKNAQLALMNYIEKVNDDVVKDYLKDINISIGVKTRELKNSLETYEQVAIDKKEHRINVIKQALKVAQASSINTLQVNQAEYLSDDTLYLLGSLSLSAMIDNEKTKPLELDSDYYNAQRALLSLTHLKVDLNNLRAYEFISKADLPLHRDSPKKTMILMISLLLGALIGIVIVLFRNLILSSRNRN